MEKANLAKLHIRCSIRTAIAEQNGDEPTAKQLRAQGNLRLMVMDDEDLQELARILETLPQEPKETIYNEIETSKSDIKKTSYHWVPDITTRNAFQSRPILN